MSKYFRCTTNKNAISYKCGEKIVFTVEGKNNGQPAPYGYLRWTLSGDDGEVKHGLHKNDNGKPFVVETSLKRPGFVHLTVRAYARDCADGSFDVLEAGAGAEIDKIKYYDTIPEDFDEYWGNIEKMIADHTPEVVYKREITDGVADGFKAYDIRVSVPCEGRPASGILTYPDDGGAYPLKLHFLGYSIFPASVFCNDNTVTFCVNAHGIENELPGTVAEFNYGPELNNYGWSYEENCSNMTTYWRNMMIRNLTAAKFAKSLDVWNKKGFTSFGGSQGALQATTLAAHDKDVTYLDINVPWFCNLNSSSDGYMKGWVPKFAEALRYFDTVAQMTRVTCPVKIGARLGDYVCPPSTTTTLYNYCKTIKSINFLQAGTHSYLPPEEKMFRLRYDPSNPSGEIKIGKYRHYKGGEYEVIGFGRDSETGEDAVIYKSSSDGEIWIRPRYMFEEYVAIDGFAVKRFEYIG